MAAEKKARLVKGSGNGEYFILLPVTKTGSIDDFESAVNALISAAGMAAGSDLTNHTGNKANPHSVTKSQVGLGNVPNVTTNDQTPTFTAATTLATLTSGEKLSVAFGKIAKAITDFISHKGSTSNPHGVTATQVGLGNVPNVATNNQTPTFSQASTLATLTSGEKLSVSMGKIMKAITDLISHLSNKSNPHGVTASQIGALSTTATAASATKLATERSIKLTGDVTGSASFNGSADASISATLASSGATAGSYGQSANASPSHGGTFTVPYVTVDAKGRVTGIKNITITLPADNNTDTKNTAGSTNTSSKIFLIGATSQGANPQTYSHDTVYIGTDGCLYSDGKKVGYIESYVTATMSASGWNSGAYSFESSYPFASYNIEIQPNGDSITAAQLEAWNAAQIVGSNKSNVCKALGTVPTVDIPVIIKVVAK